MIKRALFTLVLSATAACSAGLPGDYTVLHADRGKAWLQNSDGTLAYGGLIKQLYRDQQLILIIAYPEDSGSADDRVPIDGTCYVALLIEAQTHRLKQVSVADANRRAAAMSKVMSHERPCMKGMASRSS